MLNMAIPLVVFLGQRLISQFFLTLSHITRTDFETPAKLYGCWEWNHSAAEADNFV